MINKTFNWNRFLVWTTVPFLLLVAACTQTNKLPDNMVAQVNDSFLTADALIYNTPSGLGQDMALALKKDYIARWVESEIIYQAALNEGYKLNSKEDFFINAYAKSLLVQRYLNAKLDKDYNVTRQEIDEYYKKNRQEFIHDQDEVHIVHLFMGHRDKAIFDEIAKTDDLASLIKQYYFNERSTTEQPNGDLGYVAVTALPEAFARAIKRLKTGAVSSPIRVKDGFHFIQLLESKKAGSVKDVEQVKNEISIRLKREHRIAEKERLLNTIKNDVQIQTYLSKIQE